MEVQRQLRDMEATLEMKPASLQCRVRTNTPAAGVEATLEMNPGQEMSEDEARLVEQLENLKVEFGEMLYELRHKLNVHIASDVIDDVSTDASSL